MKWIVFTDLDGTLLDANNYSFDEAKEALACLKKEKIPLIPCTSKTYREILVIRKRLQLQGPFIVENGSAIFWPQDSLSLTRDWSLLKDNFRVKVLGVAYADILKFFKEIKKNFNLKVKGFSEMAIPEIVQRTNLSNGVAPLAAQRMYSEPFIAEEEIVNFSELTVYAQRHGFRILKGNRFYHLLGQTDKGLAVRKTLQFYRANESEERISLSLGDSPNDFEMLKATDKAVLVRNLKGTHTGGLNMIKIYLTKSIGPAGWNEAIKYFMGKYCYH